MELIVLLIALPLFIAAWLEEEKQTQKRREQFKRNADYYFYSQLHPINQDGNPYNDLPGADMIRGTDAFNHWRR